MINSAHTPGSHVFVDGPNIDMVLTDVLGHPPKSFERPRWERVYQYCRRELGCVKPTFVLNGNRFTQRVYPFYRALRYMRFDVQCPNSAIWDAVDPYIQEQLRILIRLAPRSAVSLITHDGGFAPYLGSILMNGGSVSIIGFPEEMSPPLLALGDSGASIHDLEHNVGAFNVRLPRPMLV